MPGSTQDYGIIKVHAQSYKTQQTPFLGLVILLLSECYKLSGTTQERKTSMLTKSQPCLKPCVILWCLGGVPDRHLWMDLSRSAVSVPQA